MHPIRDLSLRQRLTLALASVMVAVLIVSVTIAYVEVRYSTRMAASERLASVAEQLADLVESGAAERGELVDSLAARPEVGEALLGSPPSESERERIEQALSPLRGSSDAGLPLQLWSADRRLVFSTGAARVASPDASAEPVFDSVTTWGRLRVVGEEALYWTTIPAHVDDRIVGWVVQQRRVGNAGSVEPIQRLLGGDAVVSVTHLEDSLWVSLGGTGAAAPIRNPPLRSAFTFRRDGAEHLALVAPIEGTPWGIVVEAPMVTISARPRTFLERMAVVGLVLLLATISLGRRLARRLSGPIQELAAASDAVAAGDYDRRVGAHRGDELGRLAGAFNAMAERVSSSLRELQQRASDLEIANVEAERARREAQAASRAKSDFLATMSHEVRTPINAILGYTELLQIGVPGPLTTDQADYLTRIDRSSRLLISLVEDVLDFARMESGELRVDAAVGSPREAMGAAVAVIQPQADRKKVTLIADECPEGARFHGDPRRVQQVLLNLASNAVKFTPAGGRVEVACLSVPEGPGGSASAGWSGTWLRVDVTDTGIGIATEQLERIFEPFIQADTGYTRDYGGAGLGLSISRKLAALMGGTVTATSEPGRGSRFSLWLRAAEPETQDASRVEEASSTSG